MPVKHVGFEIVEAAQLCPVDRSPEPVPDVRPDLINARRIDADHQITVSELS
jgi:hypothetical protein